ncbi:mucin-13-like [Sardina pilchardus]|uniref:mucin-13-like n=1 Tax=Sardina pilchardus TaxID=27697 RepID=UPI002E0DDFF6
MGTMRFILLTLLLCSTVLVQGTTNDPVTPETATAPPETTKDSVTPETATAPPETTKDPVTPETATAPPETTKDPVTPETATAPPETTKDPVTPETATAPPETTKDPVTPETATAPPETTKDPVTPETATAPPETTKDPVTPETATSPPETTKDSATPEPPKPTDPCDPNPCPENSKCEEIADKKHRCICDAGLNYNENTKECEKAKVFPGDLTVKGTYNDKLADKTSKEFKEMSDNIVAELKEAFKDQKGYLSSVVLSLRKATTKVLYRTTGVIAEVENLFDVTSAVKESEVKTAIEGSKGTVLAGAAFTATDPCEKSDPCSAATTTACIYKDAQVNCTCRDGFAWTEPNNFVMCGVCPSGKKADVGECIDCPIGYSGINCEDNYLLIVIVVSSVLGVLMVVSMSVTTYAFLGKPKLKKGKKEKKDQSKGNDIGLSYQNPMTNGKPSFMVPRAGGGTDMVNNYTRPNTNVDRTANMNGYRANTPTGMESNGGGMGGYRAQAGQGLDRSANMSGYRANTPTNAGIGGGGMGGGGMGGGGMGGYRANTSSNVGMGGARVQANQNQAKDWGRPSYEEPKNSNYGMPRVGQANQPRNNPYSSFNDRRTPY